MGALLIKALFYEKSVQGTISNDIIQRVIPEDLYISQKSEEWKKLVAQQLKDLNITGMDESAAKLAFLKIIQEYPTFGSTFFVVKSTSDTTNLPETLLIAINRHGFNIINPVTKGSIAQYGFSDMNIWSSGNTYFHIRFGNMIGASKLMCETTQGYKMDDLLTSYIKYYRSMN